MVIGLITFSLGLAGALISYRRYMKKEWESLYDKTNVYGGLAMGLLMMIIGLIITFVK